jgi:hypothetical protein
LTLFVSLKESAATDPREIPQSFRQVELWANSLRVIPLSLATNWASHATWTIPSWYQDPFGVVFLQGLATYSGGVIANNAIVPIATLPVALSSPGQVRASSFGYVPASGAGFLNLSGTALTWVNISGGNITNPSVSFTGFYYYPPSPTA